MFASVVCNAAIAKKFLTDILANGPVVPLAPRSTDPATASPHPLSLQGMAQLRLVLLIARHKR